MPDGPWRVCLCPFPLQLTASQAGGVHRRGITNVDSVEPKDNQPMEKWTKDLNGRFSKAETQGAAGRPQERYSVSLVISDMNMETT